MILGFLSLLLVFHTAYVEKRSGEIKNVVPPSELFAKPPSMEEEMVITWEGLPPLVLHREFHCHSEPKAKNPDCRISLKLSAKQEALPLNEEEAKMNTLLKPYGVEEIFLEGSGRLWKTSEEFLLKGFVLKEGKREPLEISWARGGFLW